ncbi:MAG: hypothetical protein WBB28_12675 [Crinalium sp.]
MVAEYYGDDVRSRLLYYCQKNIAYYAPKFKVSLIAVTKLVTSSKL